MGRCWTDHLDPSPRLERTQVGLNCWWPDLNFAVPQLPVAMCAEPRFKPALLQLLVSVGCHQTLIMYTDLCLVPTSTMLRAWTSIILLTVERIETLSTRERFTSWWWFESGACLLWHFQPWTLPVIIFVQLIEMWFPVQCFECTVVRRSNWNLFNVLHN